MKKICSKCKIEKDSSEFYLYRPRNSLSAYCKECQKLYDKQRAEKRKEYLAQNWKKYYQEHKENIVIKDREYYRNNKEHINKLNNQNYCKNKEEINARRSENYHNKPSIRLNHLMANGIYRSIRNLKSNKHWEDFVPYSLQDLIEHLEQQFDVYMNWNNMGLYWEIDHIIPRNIFNFESVQDKDFQICWSLMNLRPLEKSANRSRPKDGSDISEELRQQILNQNFKEIRTY